MSSPQHTDADETTALVLSGGGLKGLAHVGAWRALQEVELEPDMIVGVSIGSFVGGGIASGVPQGRLEAAARNVEQDDIAVLSKRALWLNGISQEAVFRRSALRSFVEKTLPVHNFRDMSIPLHIGAVDLGRGEMEWFSREDKNVDVVQAVMASSALPGFYPPTRIGGRYYLDGGVLDSLPLQRAQELGATRIVGVDVTTGGERESAAEIVDDGMLAINERVFGLMAHRRRQQRLRHWDGPPLLHVQPDVEGIDGFSFEHNEYLIEAGYQATRKTLREAGWELPEPQGRAIPGDRHEGLADRTRDIIRQARPPSPDQGPTPRR